jgi:dCTP diphosphatase
MGNETMNLEKITEKIRSFRDERDWAQFHNPKDMAIAISLEASELLQHFLWKNPKEVEACIAEKRGEIESEIADIAICLTELADNLGIDLLKAMEDKIRVNGEKYPAERVKGSAKKYTEYGKE